MTRHQGAGDLFIGGMLILTICLSGANGCTRKPPPPPPPEDQVLGQLTRTARDAFDKGDYAAASSLYRRSLERAHIRDDFTAITDARYNLAVSLLKQDDIAGAEAHLEAAKSEFSRLKKRMPPEFALLEATLLYREGKADRAWALTDDLLTSADLASSEVLGRIHYLRGRISFDRSDPDGLRDAIRSMGQPVDTRLIADLEELKGRLAFSEQRWEEAAANFDRAAQLHRRLLNYPAMAGLLAMEARTYAQDNRPGLASIRYLQAGRSAIYRGDAVRARQWLTRAAEMAARSGEKHTSREARELLEGIDGPGP